MYADTDRYQIYFCQDLKALIFLCVCENKEENVFGSFGEIWQGYSFSFWRGYSFHEYFTQSDNKSKNLFSVKENLLKFKIESP
jgi:hypothetical protein